MAVRILLVEDHIIMREGLRGLITRQPDMEVVGEKTTATRP
jgi:DNA-binding NarL/FixJ family response regulator